MLTDSENSYSCDDENDLINLVDEPVPQLEEVSLIDIDQPVIKNLDNSIVKALSDSLSNLLLNESTNLEMIY